jgi:DNA-binding transcriptional regulator/RsmH inhibitor MraZ
MVITCSPIVRLEEDATQRGHDERLEVHLTGICTGESFQRILMHVSLKLEVDSNLRLSVALALVDRLNI